MRTSFISRCSEASGEMRADNASRLHNQPYKAITVEVNWQPQPHSLTANSLSPLPAPPTHKHTHLLCQNLMKTCIGSFLNKRSRIQSNGFQQVLSLARVISSGRTCFVAVSCHRHTALDTAGVKRQQLQHKCIQRTLGLRSQRYDMT